MNEYSRHSRSLIYFIDFYFLVNILILMILPKLSILGMNDLCLIIVVLAIFLSPIA